MSVAVLADVHANIVALRAVLADLERFNVDHIFVAGDLVGYYYWPSETVSSLWRDARIRCIRGNHEENLFRCAGDADVARTLRERYGSGYDACISELTREQFDWLMDLPASMTVDLETASFHIAHGSLASCEEYIYPDASSQLILRNFSDATFTVLGHTHHPFISVRGDKVLINPGSVGQPRDIGGIASYAVIDESSMTVRFRRVRFDTEEIIATAKQRDPHIDYLWKVMTR